MSEPRLKFEPFDRAASRAGYQCELCANGPDKLQVPALWFVSQHVPQQRIAICHRHYEHLSIAQAAAAQ